MTRNAMSSARKVQLFLRSYDDLNVVSMKDRPGSLE